MSVVRTAVFPVAGLGTRFLPATKAMPKEMLPVVDRPLIQYAVDEARAAGADRFVFVTGRGKTAIEDHFDRNHTLEAALAERGKGDLLSTFEDDLLEPGQVAYVRQMEPQGLGHAVWCARHLVAGAPFAVLLADDLLVGDGPSLAALIAVHERHGGNVVLVMEVPASETHRYGVVAPGAIRGDVVEVQDLVEKPAPGTAPSTLAVVGRYVLEPGVLDVLDDLPPGAGGEIQLTDALRRRIGEAPFHAVRWNGIRYDCGTKVGFLEASVALALDRDDLDGDPEEAVRRALARHHRRSPGQ